MVGLIGPSVLQNVKDNGLEFAPRQVFQTMIQLRFESLIRDFGWEHHLESQQKEQVNKGENDCIVAGQEIEEEDCQNDQNTCWKERTDSIQRKLRRVSK